MNWTICLVALVCTTLFFPTIALGQTCGWIYAYSDAWLDDAGRTVALNHTDADTSCGYYWAYADVKISMPSGSSQSASAGGDNFAEAIAVHPAVEEMGDGVIEGFNSGDFARGALFTVPLSSRFKVGTSFTWFQFAFETTFNRLEPCPEPGSTITCTKDNLVFGSASDIEGVYVQLQKPWLKAFGKTLCSPLANKVWSNTAPSRPYCYDLP